MTVKLPIKPLLRILHLHGADTILDISYLLEVDRSNFHKTVSDGQISHIAADRIAIRLGLHPILIWGDQWLDQDAYRAGRIDTAFDLLRQELAS